jgi:hypothetical protein
VRQVSDHPAKRRLGGGMLGLTEWETPQGVCGTGAVARAPDDVLRSWRGRFRRGRLRRMQSGSGERDGQSGETGQDEYGGQRRRRPHRGRPRLTVPWHAQFAVGHGGSLTKDTPIRSCPHAADGAPGFGLFFEFINSITDAATDGDTVRLALC